MRKCTDIHLVQGEMAGSSAVNMIYVSIYWLVGYPTKGSFDVLAVYVKMDSDTVGVHP